MDDLIWNEGKDIHGEKVLRTETDRYWAEIEIWDDNEVYDVEIKIKPLQGEEKSTSLINFDCEGIELAKELVVWMIAGYEAYKSKKAIKLIHDEINFNKEDTINGS